MLTDFDLNKKDYYFLIFITVFSTLLTVNYIIFNSNLGIYCSDVYVYLLNAVYYTGTNIRSTATIYLSPLICFLTSLFFRLGFVDKLAIYIVTGSFAIFGNIGLYLLFKRYFDETLSLTGTVIYSSLSLYLTWLGNGTLDIPAVSMIIWTCLFTIMAVDDNPKFYTWAIIFLILGVFTRYTVLLLLPAFALYYVYRKGFKIHDGDKKDIKKGLIIGTVIIIVTLALLLAMGNGNFAAKNQISEGISGTQGAEIDPAYNSDVSYYISNFLNFISNSHTYIEGNPVLENSTPLSWLTIFVLIVGAGLWIWEHKRKIDKKDAIVIILFILSALSFTRVTSVITILLALLGLYFLGRDSDNKSEYFMLAWILSNIIFYSYYTIKVNRYLLPVFPAVIYFVLLSVNKINGKIKINENILPVLLIILFIIQAFTFTYTFDETHEFKTIENVTDYITTTHPDYKNLSIGAYNVRAYNWWLGGNLLAIESSDEATIDSSNATYYISNRILDNVTNYTVEKQIEDTYIYKKSV